MKILLCTLFVFLLSSKICNAQTDNLRNFSGVWASDSTSVKMTFFFNWANKLHLTVRDTINGKKMRIRKLRIVGDTVKTTELFRSNHFLTHNKYYLVGHDTLKNLVTGDANTTLYFQRQ